MHIYFKHSILLVGLNLVNGVHEGTLPFLQWPWLETESSNGQTRLYTDISDVVLSKLKNSNTQFPNQGVWCCGKSIRCRIQQNSNYKNLGEFFYFSHTTFSHHTLRVAVRIK